MNDKVKIEFVTSKEDFAAWAMRYTEKNWEDWGKLLKDLFTCIVATLVLQRPPRMGRPNQELH